MAVERQMCSQALGGVCRPSNEWVSIVQWNKWSRQGCVRTCFDIAALPTRRLRTACFFARIETHCESERSVGVGT